MFLWNVVILYFFVKDFICIVTYNSHVYGIDMWMPVVTYSTRSELYIYICVRSQLCICMLLFFVRCSGHLLLCVTPPPPWFLNDSLMRCRCTDVQPSFLEDEPHCVLSKLPPPFFYEGWIVSLASYPVLFKFTLLYM